MEYSSSSLQDSEEEIFHGDVTGVQVTKAEVYLRLFSTCSVSCLIVFILLFLAHGVGGRQHSTTLEEPFL